MKQEVTKFNLEVCKKALKDVQGKTVSINEVNLYGVVSIDFEKDEVYDADPDESIGYDGGREEFVIIRFHFKEGYAAYSFCSDREHCQVTFETDDLWIFQVEDIQAYVKKEKDLLDYQLEEYERYMSR